MRKNSIFYGKVIAKKTLRFFLAFCFTVCFTSVTFAAGYTCSSYKKYTSCNQNYYLNGTGAGNSCSECPNGCTCAGGTEPPQCCSTTKACSTLGSGWTGTYNECTGNQSSQCYKTCTKACTQQTCPTNATCTHGATSTSGKQYYGGSCDAAASTCTITITCNPGYYLSGSTCKPCNGNKWYCPGDNNWYTASTGYYTTGGTETTRTGQAKCTAGTYCTDGVKYNCDSGYTSADGASARTQCYKSCTTACTQQACPTNAYSCTNGTKDTSGTLYYGGTCSATAAACPVTITYCKNGYYLSNNTCTKCPTDYPLTDPQTSEYSNETSINGCWRMCNASDVPNSSERSGWKEYSGNNTCKVTTCSPGYYLSDGTCKPCNGNKWYCPGDNKWYDVDSGYYTTGGTETTRTGQTKCTTGTYCSAGVKYDCPSGYTSAAGATAQNQCYQTCTKACTQQTCPTNAYSCTHGTTSTSGTLYYGGTCDAAASTCSISVSKCKNGYYLSNGQCSLCPADFPITDPRTAAYSDETSIDACWRDCNATDVPNSTARTGWKEKGGNNTCKATACAAGYYLSENVCKPCNGNKWYCPGDNKWYDVDAGYYTTGGTETTRTGQAKCTGATYCTNGIKYNCPDGFDANTTDGKTAAAQCQMQTTDGYGIENGDYVQTKCDPGYYCWAALVNYGSYGAWSKCPDGYTSAAGSSKQSQCYQTCTKACTQQACPTNATCTHGATSTSGKLYYGGTCDAAASTCTITITCNPGYYLSGTTCKPCSGNKWYCPGDNKWYDVDTGYYTTGGTETTRTGQAKCTAGTYCTDGVKYNCDSGYTSADGASARTQCYKSCTTACTQPSCVTNAYSCTYGTTSTSGTQYYGDTCSAPASTCSVVPSKCKNGYYLSNNTCTKCPTDYPLTDPRNAEYSDEKSIDECWRDCNATDVPNSTARTGWKNHAGNNTCKATACADGYYLLNNTCVQCTGATYCTNSTKYDCPDGFDANTTDGKTAATQCQMQTTDGYAVERGATKQTTCDAGFYCWAALVNYGSYGAWSKCPDGYTSAAGSSKQSQCYQTCTKACTQQVCPTNATCTHGATSTSGKLYYGSSCDAAASSCSISITCNPGYYLSDGKCLACSGNKWYCPGDNKWYTASTGYYTTGGTETTRTGQAKCTAGTYCTDGVKYNCDSGYTSADGASARTQCYKSCTTACTQQACPTNAYSCTHGATSTSGTQYYGGACDAAASTCSISISKCKNGYYLSNNQCNLCPSDYPLTDPRNAEYSDEKSIDECWRDCNASDVPNSTTRTGWKNHAGNNTCKATTCADGYNLTTADKCEQLCTTGISKIKIGGITIPLYSARHTTPALNIKYKDKVCYGNLETGKSSGALNINFDGTTYHSTN